MSEPKASAGELSAATVSFITTEHFTLQGARAQTISESTGRVSMFLGAASGGLVALGLLATAANIGTAFYAVALALLPTLSFVGLVTFERVLQNGLEDLGYAARIARIRGFYFEHAPELDGYMLSVAPESRVAIQGLPHRSRWQRFLTTAWMTAVITSVLAGASASLVVAVFADHSLAGSLAAGGAVAIAALVALTHLQHLAWTRQIELVSSSLA
ncbi:MAG TPA: hypothetical protein VGM91_14610 [Conexibacter sp.]|jgi:hypothetical protein